MPKLRVRHDGLFLARRYTPVLLLSGFLLTPNASLAQINLGPIVVGAGIQTDFTHTQPSSGSSDDAFSLDHARIYISGPVTDSITFQFNTDYDSVSNKLGIMDAVAQFKESPQVNIWFGRFLPPGDRSNLYGPFFSNQWGVYTDGIQDGYPGIFQGRQNGIMYWGDFAKKLKLSFGAFDGKSLTGDPKVLVASRIQIDFWDSEEGWYQNGTYYGDKNVLAIGGATQIQSDHTASTIDFFLEKKLHNNGVIDIESEMSDYNRLGGYDPLYPKSEGAYGLASYLFPKVVPIGKLNGKFEILGKFADAAFTHGKSPSYDQKTTEFNFNYVMKEFKARLMSFYRDTRFNREHADFWQLGLGLQIQM